MFLSAATTIVISKYMGDGKFVLIGNIIETEFITNSAWGNGSDINDFACNNLIDIMAYKQSY